MNTSGLHMTADKVLMRLAAVKDKTSGGIALPDKTIQKETQAQYVGVLVDAGPVARASDYLLGINDGDLVIFAKYAGLVAQGADGMYRIVRMEDVIGKADAMYDERLLGSIPMPDNS